MSRLILANWLPWQQTDDATRNTNNDLIWQSSLQAEPILPDTQMYKAEYTIYLIHFVPNFLSQVVSFGFQIC